MSEEIKQFKPELGVSKLKLMKKKNKDFKQDFEWLIELRKIKEEDINIIEKLFNVPKDIFIGYHNFFTSAKEDTERRLKTELEAYEKELKERKQKNDTEMIKLLENKIEYLLLFSEFAEKYDYCACWHLNTFFENLKK